MCSLPALDGHRDDEGVRFVLSLESVLRRKQLLIEADIVLAPVMTAQLAIGAFTAWSSHFSISFPSTS